MRAGNLAREMNDSKTPGQAAYEAWLQSMGCFKGGIAFEQLREQDQIRWHAVADAVIYQARHIITEEIVRAGSVTQQRTEAQ